MQIKVLVVDDILVDRMVIKKTLQPEFSVTTLSSATEAIAFSRSHSFHVAIIHVLPSEDLNCIHLLNDLKLMNRFNFLPLACTCYVDEIRQRKIMDAGFHTVIQKPFDKIVFVRIIIAAQLFYQVN